LLAAGDAGKPTRPTGLYGLALGNLFETVSDLARFSLRIAYPRCVDVSAIPRAIDRRAAS